MKISNLFQDHESPAPYADSIVLDAGGVDVRFGDESIAHVSFENLDPFEIAFHAIPDDWEPHKEYEYDLEADTLELFEISQAELAENAVNRALIELGKARGWERA